MKVGDKCFVYGTLRTGERAGLDENPYAEFVGNDKINGKIFDLGPYPGVKAVPCDTYDDEASFVVGEVYTVLHKVLPVHLDSYEGYPSLYNRIETRTKSGLSVWVYTYNYETADSQLIQSGDWKQRVDYLPRRVLVR